MTSDNDKISKHKANYRIGRGPNRCESCNMYLPKDKEEGSCTLVRGVIFPRDVCDYFERKK